MPALFDDLRTVLFDLDGTLVETHIDFPAMTRTMEELARSYGVLNSVIEGLDILGMVEAAAADVQKRGDDGSALRQAAFAQLQDMEIASCAHPVLLPGTQALLTRLIERSLKVGVVTRNCRRVSVGLLAQFTLPHHLLLTRDDVPLTKPNPEHLWEALRLLDALPEQTLMVGDHWMDIQAGVRANCAATLGVLGRHDMAWFAPCPPTVMVRDLTEALPLLGAC